MYYLPTPDPRPPLVSAGPNSERHSAKSGSAQSRLDPPVEAVDAPGSVTDGVGDRDLFHRKVGGHLGKGNYAFFKVGGRMR